LSDVTKWKVRGPVATLSTEFATWDLNQEAWQPAQSLTVVTFRPDGKASTSDFHNPDGSVAHTRWYYDDAGRLTETNFWLNDAPPNRAVYSYDNVGRHVRTVEVNQDGTQKDSEICSYDASGQKTKVHFIAPQRSDVLFGVEGTDYKYGAPGATTMTVTYDEHDLLTEVHFHDVNRHLLRQVTFIRDSTGRLLSEEMRLVEMPFPNLLKESPESSSPEAHARKLATLTKLLGAAQGFSSTTYAYDPKGRLLERTHRMGALGEDRATYRYDDHDNPIEETTEHRSRDASIKEDGTIDYSADHLNIQHNRLEYRYDAQGNWTERIVSFRVEPNPDFQRSNVEPRTITYHPVAPA